MNLITIAFKSLRERALSSVLTSLSVALGVMLMVAVLVIYGIISNMFGQQSIGYDLIVGPKGSDLQLVLSTVYRISPPIENLPYSFYRTFKERYPGVETTIPVALGDTTEAGAFPICGTIPDYFAHEFAPKREFRVRGEFFRKPFQAVIGSQVARTNGWDLGTQLKLVHGGADTGHVHDEKFEVVGVLAPTGTPNDRTVFVHLAGFYSISGHDKPFDEGIIRERAFYNLPPLSPEELAKEVAVLEKKYSHDHEHKPGTQHFHDIAEVQKEVTSILVKCDPKYPTAPLMIAGQLKDGFQAQGVNPIRPMRQLMDNLLGNVRNMLLVLTALIILVSGIGIFVSIYNSMAARKREIAIMRALGAQRGTVFGIILAESILLCVGGGLLGLLLGHGLVFAAAPIVEVKAGLLIDPWKFELMELTLIPALILLAALVGFLPGLTAYRTDVAEALSN